MSQEIGNGLPSKRFQSGIKRICKNCHDSVYLEFDYQNENWSKCPSCKYEESTGLYLGSFEN